MSPSPEMFDWREVNADPTHVPSQRRLDAYLSAISHPLSCSRRHMLEAFCRQRRVLDIGAGEHDPALFSPESWEHGMIATVAEKAVAVDIDPAICAHYREKGYDFRCVDATGDEDLGERFDRIFLGDVIEHVNDSVALLRFAARHLAPGGRMLVTTPNPFHPHFQRKRRKLGGQFVLSNLEHVCWISAQNMFELALRSDLVLCALYWPLPRKAEKGVSGWVRRQVLWLKQRLLPPESLWTEYVFELGVAEDTKGKPSPSLLPMPLSP